jgi:hypothetical protein
MARGHRGRAKGYVGLQEARYIELTLQSTAPTAKKQALQRLCKLYRGGFRLAAPMVIKGLILQNPRDPDAKVKRWAFNTLSQFGTADDVPIMMPALDACRADSEIFEAGVTALAHMLPKDQVAAVLAHWGVTMDPETVLALAQQSTEYEAELADVHLDIDIATTEQLRAGTLLVGLQRAPEGLFSRHHPVTEVIGALNEHSDPIVAQYSFWAAVEHPRLGVDQMRVQPKDFLTLPANVQGWAFRVLTKDAERTKSNYDLIVEASESKHLETREGLAFGIRDIYYDSLDINIIDWYVEEEAVVVKEKLLEHMSAQASESSRYREHVELAFRATAPGSPLRARLEALPILNQLKAELDTYPLEEAAIVEGNSVVSEAIKEPTYEKVERVMKWAGVLNKGGQALAGLARSADTISTELHHILPHLPHMF